MSARLAAISHVEATRLPVQPYLGFGLFGGSAAAGVELGAVKSGGIVRAGGG